MSYISGAAVDYANTTLGKDPTKDAPLNSNHLVRKLLEAESKKPLRMCFECSSGVHLKCSVGLNCKCENPYCVKHFKKKWSKA